MPSFHSHSSSLSYIYNQTLQAPHILTPGCMISPPPNYNNYSQTPHTLIPFAQLYNQTLLTPHTLYYYTFICHLPSFSSTICSFSKLSRNAPFPLPPIFSPSYATSSFKLLPSPPLSPSEVDRRHSPAVCSRIHLRRGPLGDFHAHHKRLAAPGHQAERALF